MLIADSKLEVTFHRTVRVPDGRQPSNLPPSLGRMSLYPVHKYADKCPESWEKSGYFMALHDTEAMWMSFHSRKYPLALMIGAGGINALTGQKLGTKLEKDNYLVTPPQPWLDGWKDTDGTVYQFVATPYQKGKGISVAEQLIGEESKTGALGIALFESKDPAKLTPKMPKFEGWSESMTDQDFNWQQSCGGYGGLLKSANFSCSVASASCEEPVVKGLVSSKRSVSFSEMGIGRGGKIIQKIYPDPHGLEVWKEEPISTMAFYLVNAEVFEEITGVKVPKPVGHENYGGNWFGVNDSEEGDVAGSDKFTGLKSAVFPASELVEKEK